MPNPPRGRLPLRLLPLLTLLLGVDQCEGCDEKAQEALCNASATTCAGGMLTYHELRNGECIDAWTLPCHPYGCDEDGLACATSCVTTADCWPNTACNSEGVCVPWGTTCRDNVTVMDASGSLYNCAPYVCVAGECTSTCDSDSDCASGATCQRRECLPTDTGA